MRSQKRVQGFSTLELLIATAILGIVTVQILGVVGTQQRNFALHQDLLETQEDARLVADLILTDVRMAGFMVPNIVGISSVDGGSNSSDRLCVSHADAIDAGTLADMSWRFDGAHLSAAINGAVGSIALNPATIDIDGNATVDFGIGWGIIIANGTRSHCARITALDTGSGAVQFTPSTPSGFTAGTTDTRVAPAVVYEVTGNGLERNGQVFSRQVEDLQIEFNPSGAWIDSLDGSLPGGVDLVRLSVVTRTERDDIDAVAGQRPAVANRDAGSADNFRRRIIAHIVAPRNFM